MKFNIYFLKYFDSFYIIDSWIYQLKWCWFLCPVYMWQERIMYTGESDEGTTEGKI